ncbi:unnamed protein product [Didymodactylos carnosus]|uniref:Uncharacterized protein n=1 Tax=Didymodactylos carnosus TaxID=1234261 RepID=A0A815LFI9_9BILA|nr:unnamed protein product [Didymodactylos carnosus]CAF4297415.1 unnamed protein product [Didymodactylos carnosus]
MLMVMAPKTKIQVRGKSAIQKRYSAESDSSGSESEDYISDEGELVEAEAAMVLEEEDKEPLNFTNKLFVNDIGDLFGGGKHMSDFWDYFPDILDDAKAYAFERCTEKSASFTSMDLALEIDKMFYEQTGTVKRNPNMYNKLKKKFHCNFALRAPYYKLEIKILQNKVMISYHFFQKTLVLVHDCLWNKENY